MSPAPGSAYGFAPLVAGVFIRVLPVVWAEPEPVPAPPTADVPAGVAAPSELAPVAPAPDPTAPDGITSDPAALDPAASDPAASAAEREAARDAREREQVELLDLVREGLVEESRSWARRVRALRRWAELVPPGESFEQLEMAGSWQVSQLTATRWRDEAERLVDCLPLTLAALEAGTLLVHQAQVLLRRTRHCSEQVARAVEAEVLPVAAGLIPSDLGKRVDRAVLRIEAELTDAAATEQRHADAAAQRRTWTAAEPDGMGLAGAVLTAEQLVAWQAGLDQLEKRERIADREAGIERTRDQRRADLFAALPAMVLAGIAQDASAEPGSPWVSEQQAPGAGRPWTLGPEQVAAQVVLNVHVPVATVLDLSREPGALAGYGPVAAAHVRLLRPHSLRRILVDARSGRPIAVDDRTIRAESDSKALRKQVRGLLTPAVVTDVEEPQHDPSAHLARLVDVRDVHCCGPGCSSSRTDRDHLVPYPTGPTSAGNLGRLSPRCHRAKHDGWTLVRHPDGSTAWTSPLGRTYRRPSPHVPPPDVDLWQKPPAVRPRPVGSPDQPEADDDDEDDAPADGAPADDAPVPPPASDDPAAADAPPFDPTPPPF